MRTIDQRGYVTHSVYDGLGRVLETRLRHSSEVVNSYHQHTTYCVDCVRSFSQKGLVVRYCG